ncbi:Trm112 family protein [Pelagibacterium flavum]|uniref:Trm112 family protein n=1 Tax=Pelagibacterium flavum TaxID=2984530 RepID=A0ABY6IP23_9HYPH|nr:Trm112 family protein [Pelagibacterium sp. YIM 151497]UYQ72340.1 Trm112 family protein [Pelagibacterium sp. YIM 151497]|tara:strand:+ start:457 stop:714 length:258 start_codon:yes stop_codon:yes gene_type:complete
MTSPDAPPPDDNPRYRLDPRTIEMLVCPVTKTRLTLSADGSELISIVARYAFPIRKGVPLLVIDAARRIDEDEAEALRNRPASDN